MGDGWQIAATAGSITVAATARIAIAPGKLGVLYPGRLWGGSSHAWVHGVPSTSPSPARSSPLPSPRSAAP